MERRHGLRLPPEMTRFAPLAILRPAREVVVIDLSSRGALIESPTRLPPGSITELHLFGGPRCVLRGRLDRCRVSRLDPLRYEAAILFDEHLEHS